MLGSSKMLILYAILFAIRQVLKKIPLLIVKDICGHMTNEMPELYQKHATMDAKREQMRLLEGSMNFLPAIDEETEVRLHLAELSQTLPFEKIKDLLKIAEK